VDEYCRQIKTMANTLRTLGAPITDECLVFNILRGLSPRFDRITPILTRMKPFPTFAETKNDLLLEELRLSATAALQRSSGCPLCLGGGGSSSPHYGPRHLELFGSLLAPGGSRSKEWTQWHDGRPRQLSGWFPVAIFLQPVNWHHPHVARAIRGYLGPSPRHPSAGLLCRSTSDSALGTSPASAGAPSPSRASGPTCVGALG
jgi:hypothetical protein